MATISRTPAASKGQNYRGAGRRYDARDAVIIRERFSRWLRRMLCVAAIDARELAKALADDPSDHNRVSRTQVQDWLAGTRTVSAISAYRVGEALRSLGVAWSCGPLALYAAGHFAQFLLALRTISHLDTDLAREFVAGLMVYCEVLAEYDLADGFTAGMPLLQSMTSHRPDVEHYIALAARLPSAIDRIRRYTAHACQRMGGELATLERTITKTSTTSNRPIDRLFLNPAIGLFESGAPLLVARSAARELLQWWSHEIQDRYAGKSDLPAMELWGDAVVVAVSREGDQQLRASPLFDDRYLPDAVDILRDVDTSARGIASARSVGPLEPKS